MIYSAYLVCVLFGIGVSPDSTCVLSVSVEMRIFCAAVIFCLTGFAFVAEAHESVTLFYSDWGNGIDKRIEFQVPQENSIELVDSNGMGLKKAVKVTIDKDENYSGVANGSPRAEMSFNKFLHFRQKIGYSIKWQIFIPNDYLFDNKQPELVAQIHQGPPAGYPPFALFFAENGKYEVRSRTQSQIDSVNCYFGNLADDRGRVVDWELSYFPDGTGSEAVTELYKSGKLVFSIKGIPNAYESDDRAYLKLGIYKADWIKKPSDVEVRTLYYGNVAVAAKE